MSQMKALGPVASTPDVLSPDRAWRAQTVAEQIASKIGELILSNEIRPGEPLRELSLSAQFTTSRGPIRDALRILEKEGLVDISSRRGAHVTRLSAEEVTHIFDIRSVLMGYAARVAARRRDPECIRALSEGVADLEENRKGGDNLDEHFRVSAQMNYTLCERSQNPRLLALVFQLARQTARYTRLGLSTPERRTESVKTWRLLIQHIKDGRERQADELEQDRVLAVQKLAVEILSEPDYVLEKHPVVFPPAGVESKTRGSRA